MYIHLCMLSLLYYLYWVRSFLSLFPWYLPPTILSCNSSYHRVSIYIITWPFAIRMHIHMHAHSNTDTYVFIYVFFLKYVHRKPINIFMQICMYSQFVPRLIQQIAARLRLQQFSPWNSPRFWTTNSLLSWWLPWTSNSPATKPWPISRCRSTRNLGDGNHGGFTTKSREKWWFHHEKDVNIRFEQWTCGSTCGFNCEIWISIVVVWRSNKEHTKSKRRIEPSNMWV